MRPGWTNFHPGSYFVSAQPSHLSPLLVHRRLQFFFSFFLVFIIFVLPFPPPKKIIPTSSVSAPDFFFFFTLSSSNFLCLFFSPLSLSQCFHHFRLIPPTPLPPPIHIFKHKPAHWFQTKCVHSNISINWVGEALTLITATTLCFRHVGGIMDYY